MECPECKNDIDEKVFYCPICGKKIKGLLVPSLFLCGCFNIKIINKNTFVSIPWR